MVHTVTKGVWGAGAYMWVCKLAGYLRASQSALSTHAHKKDYIGHYCKVVVFFPRVSVCLCIEEVVVVVEVVVDWW